MDRGGRAHARDECAGQVEQDQIGGERPRREVRLVFQDIDDTRCLIHLGDAGLRGCGAVIHATLLQLRPAVLVTSLVIEARLRRPPMAELIPPAPTNHFA